MTQVGRAAQADDRQKALDAIAEERAKDMKPVPAPVTLQSLDARLTALENALKPKAEETNG